MNDRPSLGTSEYQRNLVMLILDRSGSMASSHREDGVTTTRMKALESAVKTFLVDTKTGLRSTKIGPTAEIAIGCFSGSRLEWQPLGPSQGGPFTLLRDINVPPPLPVAPGELTPMALAIKEGVAAMQARIAQIQGSDLLSLQYRPTMFLLTDGKPEPDGQDIGGATSVLHAAAFKESGRPDFFFYAMGINEADDSLMKRIAPNAYYPLRGISLAQIMKIVTITANQTTGYIATQKAVEEYMKGAPRIGEA